jgi:hypothetical protein
VASPLLVFNRWPRRLSSTINFSALSISLIDRLLLDRSNGGGGGCNKDKDEAANTKITSWQRKEKKERTML